MHNKKLKDFTFAKRASSYDEGFEGKASRKFYSLMLREVKLTAGASVLDMGCGTGELLRQLSNACAIDGYGVDAEHNMIAVAKCKCPRMHFQQARCEETPFDDQSFDAVIACMAYHHFADKEGFAREAARLLKPGGFLYVADPRFPLFVRKAINGVVRHIGVAGEFFAPEEIAARFSGFGFELAGIAFDGYAQVVTLKRLCG